MDMVVFKEINSIIGPCNKGKRIRRYKVETNNEHTCFTKIFQGPKGLLINY